MKNPVAKNAHLAGRAGVHEKSGKHYRRNKQIVLDLEEEYDYDTSQTEEEEIEDDDWD